MDSLSLCIETTPLLILQSLQTVERALVFNQRSPRRSCKVPHKDARVERAALSLFAQRVDLYESIAM